MKVLILLSWREANSVLSVIPATPLAAGTAYSFGLGLEAKSSVGIPIGESQPFSLRTSP